MRRRNHFAKDLESPLFRQRIKSRRVFGTNDEPFWELDERNEDWTMET